FVFYIFQLHMIFFVITFLFFFFTATATTVIYTLSLHDALPIFLRQKPSGNGHAWPPPKRRHCSSHGIEQRLRDRRRSPSSDTMRSEEHTSELQSRRDLVCRLLLEKKKGNLNKTIHMNCM